jgi:hypothetical protein
MHDPDAPPDARERYLRWEIDLVRQIEREGDLGFRTRLNRRDNRSQETGTSCLGTVTIVT